jgi:hypothetical protein
MINQNLWFQVSQNNLMQQQQPINAEQQMQQENLRNNKEVMNQLQVFLTQNPNPTVDQIQQVAMKLNIAPEYISKSVTARQNQQQNILMSLNPHFLTGDKAMQALPMPPFIMFRSNNGPINVAQNILPPQLVNVVNAPSSAPPAQQKSTTKTTPKLTEAEKKLKPMLDEKQGIATVDNVSQLLKQMGGEKTQKGRQTFIEAILNTTKTPILKKLVELKVVDLLKKWLEEAKVKEKDEIMVQIMQVIMKLPLNLDVLTSSGIGKVVTQLKKDTSLSEGKLFSLLSVFVCVVFLYFVIH